MSDRHVVDIVLLYLQDTEQLKVLVFVCSPTPEKFHVPCFSFFQF